MPAFTTPVNPARMSEEALRSLDSMEGVYSLPVVETVRGVRVDEKPAAWLGYCAVAIVAGIAYGIHYLPFPPFRMVSGAAIRRPVSAAILAIAAGALLRNLAPMPASVIAACKGIVRKLIPITIVLTGAGLNLAHMAAIGPAALGITIVCIAVATGAAWYFGRLFRVSAKTATLIGAGTAICGTSAIVAIAPLIDAEDDDLTISVGTVNLLGLVLMFVLPLLGGLLKLGDTVFGVWAGTSIHAVPQVVAAGFAYSEPAGTLATLVKLVRVAMLAPFTFALAVWHAKHKTGTNLRIRYSRLVPPFLWGFLALALLNTLNAFPSLEFHLAEFVPVIRVFRVSMAESLVNAGEVLLAIAMAAMGLELNIRYLTRVGGSALLTGVAAAVALVCTSLLLCGGTL